jgi:O-antigen/teichoic acid export membrane protein
MAAVVPVAFFLGYLHMAVGLGRRYLRINVVALVVNLLGNAVFTLGFGAAATARVSWVTEALVVVLSYSALWRTGASGRAAGLRMAAVLAVVVVGAELTGSDVLVPGLAGLIVALGAVCLGGRRLLDFGRLVRGRPTGAGSPAG